ncbi:MAG TPA: SDR family NAD(P)-dependent oxidoreductase [Polyangiaceae bacterium]|nr:SDR family NAD(P)-dependent oxidoreductase [Polyangiaceae bacterium]
MSHHVEHEVDVLVNNAGYSVLGAVEETTDEELRTAFETMFFGAVAATRAVLPHMGCSRRLSASKSRAPPTRARVQSSQLTSA